MSTTLLVLSSGLLHACDAVRDAEHVNACEGGRSATVLRKLESLDASIRRILSAMCADSWAGDLSARELCMIIRALQDARMVLADCLYDSAHRLIRNGSKRDVLIRDARDAADAAEESIRGVLEARKRSGMPDHAVPVSRYDAPAKHTTWTADNAEACGTFDVCEDGSIRERLDDIPRNPAACERVRMLVRDRAMFYMDCNGEHYARLHKGADVGPGDVWRACDETGRACGPWRNWNGTMADVSHGVREV